MEYYLLLSMVAEQSRAQMFYNPPAGCKIVGTYILGT